MNTGHYGYYYSPEDKPLWVCAEAGRTWEERTGRYLENHLTWDGKVWSADMHALSREVRRGLVESYITSRICENLYYYSYVW